MSLENLLKQTPVPFSRPKKEVLSSKKTNEKSVSEEKIKEVLRESLKEEKGERKERGEEKKSLPEKPKKGIIKPGETVKF